LRVKNLESRYLSSFISRLHLSGAPERKLLRFFLFLMLCTLPLKAFSADCDVTGDLPFNATNNTEGDICLSCLGPWARQSNDVVLSAGLQTCTFYAADKTIFSPFGRWDCDVKTVEDGKCGDTFVSGVTFCLTDNGEPVGLVVGPTAKEISVNFPTGACGSSSVTAFLGDNTKHDTSKRDFDSFLFSGSAGDEVRLRLRPDRQGGNNGGEATLGISGGSLNEETSGKLPLALDATLPEDGDYLVTVGQPRNPGDGRFRGGYSLRVNIPAGSPGLISPANDVEK